MDIKCLCKVGIHRPLTGHEYAFVDTISGKAVYTATCPCGKSFLTDSSSNWIVGFTVERETEVKNE